MIHRFIHQHSLIAFFIFAYGFSWALGLPRVLGYTTGFPIEIVLGSMGPALAAILVTVLMEGRGGVWELLSRVLRWRVGLLWWALALLGCPLLMLLAITLNRMVGASLGQSPTDHLSSPWLMGLLVVGVLFAAVLEEIGWRGYAWPKLIQHHRFLVAGIVLGTLWSGWHLPLFFIKGMPQSNLPLLPYFVMAIAVTLWLGWLYCRTGSILLAAVFHAALNFSGSLPGSENMTVLATFAGLCLMLTAGLVFCVPKSLGRFDCLRN